MEWAYITELWKLRIESRSKVIEFANNKNSLMVEFEILLWNYGEALTEKKITREKDWQEFVFCISEGGNVNIKIQYNRNN